MGVSGCDIHNGSATTVVDIILPQLPNPVQLLLCVLVPRCDASFMIFWQRWDVPAGREEQTAWAVEGRVQVAGENS